MILLRKTDGHLTEEETTDWGCDIKRGKGDMPREENNHKPNAFGTEHHGKPRESRRRPFTAFIHALEPSCCYMTRVPPHHLLSAPYLLIMNELTHTTQTHTSQQDTTYSKETMATVGRFPLLY